MTEQNKPAVATGSLPASACPWYKYFFILSALFIPRTIRYPLFYTGLYCNHEAQMDKIPRQWYSPLPLGRSGLYPEESILLARFCFLFLSFIPPAYVVCPSLPYRLVHLFLVSSAQALHLYAFTPGRAENGPP